ILIFGEHRFIGLENYRFLLSDGRFWSALGNTCYFAFVAVSLELILGVIVALLLHAAGPGAGLLRVSVLLPWALPRVVSAKVWAWLFNPHYGLVTRLLPARDANVLGLPGWAMHAAILVDVWKTTPFVALLVLAGLKGIPDDLYQAARIDGASRLRTF